jgi:putative MATE family efflux protein
MNKERDLSGGSIKKHIKDIALPASIGYFFHTMFNVTDTYFAGQISSVALAALSFNFSIFFMILAIAGGMSQGVTALVGNTLGEKDITKARHIMLNSFFFAVVLSFVLSVTGFLVAPYLLELLGAKGEYLKESLSYIDIIIIASIFYVGAFFCNAALNAIGNTKAFRNFLTAGFVINIFLDYWFIVGGAGLKPMGIGGIALATTIVEFFGFYYLFWILKKSYLFEDLPKFNLDVKVIFALLKQGFPPTVNMMLMALGMYIITYFIASFGDYAVAGYGVAVRIEQIVLLPSIGINVAVLTIVSHNNGANEVQRIIDTVKYAKKIGFVLWILSVIFIFLFAKELLHFFSDNDKIIEVGKEYLFITATALYAYMLVFIHISLLQGIKQPSFLVTLGLARQIIIPILIFSLLRYLNLPILFYWVSMAATIWFSAFLIIWYSKRKIIIRALQ